MEKQTTNYETIEPDESDFERYPLPICFDPEEEKRAFWKRQRSIEEEWREWDKKYGKGELVLQQDDCAPDSMEYFEKQFLEMFKTTFTQFKIQAKKTTQEMGADYDKDNIHIEWSCEDPFYKVYKK